MDEKNILLCHLVRILSSSGMEEKFLLILVLLFCLLHNIFSTGAQECGKRQGFIPTIFRGKSSTRAEWPWNVALVHRQYENFFCGGTLISEKHVLSG